jgi:hypothetical protein
MSKSYVAASDAFILGTHYTAGDPVEVTQAQAKYLTAPLGDQLSEAGSQKPPKAATSKLTRTPSDGASAQASK